jgi:hypothetical protein
MTAFSPKFNVGNFLPTMTVNPPKLFSTNVRLKWMHGTRFCQLDSKDDRTTCAVKVIVIAQTEIRQFSK